MPSGVLRVHPFRLGQGWSGFRALGVSVSNFSQDPDSLLRFFILLATSSKEDLGFEANIENIGETNFHLRFAIQGGKYDTSKLLYDIGARTAIGRGTRVFEVMNRMTERVYIIKDCWIDDYPGKHLEHDIITGVKNDMDDNDFHSHFVDICGHHKTVTSGAFGNLCEILKSTTSVPRNHFDPHAPIPATSLPKPIYVSTVQGGVADQPTRMEQVLVNAPRPRCRYQVVYDEKGISLFDVTSFADVFVYIGQATDGM